MTKRITTILSVLMVGGLLFSGNAVAQDATPIVPDPSLCTLTPPSYEEVAQLAATPVAEASPTTEGTPAAELPAGEPVDDATRAAVEQSMIVNVACLNSGSTLLWMAVYTDHALASIINGTGEFPRDLYDSLATPEVVTPDQWTVIIEFEDMVMLPDGRVAAIIVGDNRADDTSPAAASLFYLAEKDGHWYIDDFVNPDE